eukprot:TRINITY_DN12409_c0_g1_i5.p1 TRINITY_DN12409_c0_g1~~TRINITY_DN12409_c0_g1_i5.p1  ORF type:complete len:424 (-),score=94.98 TRINITY_DN12409_c0_g1_i5:263-1534(-)
MPESWDSFLESVDELPPSADVRARVQEILTKAGFEAPEKLDGVTEGELEQLPLPSELPVRAFFKRVLRTATEAGAAKRRRVADLSGGVQSGPGRSASVLTVGARYFVGVDIGGTTFAVTLVDERGAALGGVLQRDVGSDKSVGVVVASIAAAVKEKVSQAKDVLPDGLQDVAAVGLGMPGIHDTPKGIVRTAANFPWRGVPLTKLMSEALCVPHVYLENDANAALLAEVWVGAAKGAEDAVMLTLGTGIGGAIYTGGRLLRGANSMAGEVGHSIVEPGGRPNAPTGVRGIFEAYASGTAVGAIFQERLASQERNGHSGVTCADVFARASAGDVQAKVVVDETYERLGIGCIDLCRYVDPSVILLTGGMTLAGQSLLKGVQAAFLKHHWSIQEPHVKIAFAAVGNLAGAIGAAYNARLQLDSQS